MPSPIAHTAASFAIYRIYAGRWPQMNIVQVASLPRLLIITTIFSLVPDLDFAFGLLLGDFDQFHNGVTHSLFSGLLFALGIAIIAWLSGRANFKRWFVLALLCYELHVIMDFFTVGRGVPLLWPFSEARYIPTLKLFYGLHRSDGWLSVRHLWTLITESAFAFLVVVLTNWATRGLSKSE